jgi:transcription initiation factor TFIID TATA-box-binding protein
MSREGLLKKADETIDIRNIVARISFRQALDLRKVVSRLKEPYKAYRRPPFPGVIVKESGGPTFLLFRTGSGICVGNRSVLECKKSTETLYDRLMEKDIIKDSGFELDIQNIVAKAYLGFNIDVDRLSEVLERVIYEPEIFPAAIHYMDRPKLTMLIFQNGKTIIAGAKSEEEIAEAYQKTLTILEPIGLGKSKVTA